MNPNEHDHEHAARRETPTPARPDPVEVTGAPEAIQAADVDRKTRSLRAPIRPRGRPAEWTGCGPRICWPAAAGSLRAWPSTSRPTWRRRRMTRSPEGRRAWVSGGGSCRRSRRSGAARAARVPGVARSG